jgi:hypothetical protein
MKQCHHHQLALVVLVVLADLQLDLAVLAVQLVLAGLVVL